MLVKAEKILVFVIGLGKTFIAAVVMYNFYRWFPLGKVIFMAPTKPLVHQQIDSCYKVMGIPKEDTAELTGVYQLSRCHGLVC
jgi:Fanconi anemia group M protein